LKLSDRQWICPQCGKIIERDYNAAMNILDEGLKIIGLSSPEFTLVDYPTMDDKEITTPLKSSGRMKQEKNVI
jgi:transposase